MKSNYLDKLKSCASPEEVYKTMNGMSYPGSSGSRFEDQYILLPNATNGFFKMVPPAGIVGLALRTILFLKLSGDMGKIPLRSGKSSYARDLFTTIYEMGELVDISKPDDITNFSLDIYIESHINKGNDSATIMDKMRKLQDWSLCSDFLPYFLRLNKIYFSESEKYKLLEETFKKEKNSKRRIGSVNPPYPLSKLKKIVSQAIYYIENYGEDSMVAAKIYSDSCKDGATAMVARRKAVESYRSSSHVFKKPALRDMNKHCLKLESNSYQPMPALDKKTGPLMDLVKSVRELQESCVIVILMVTAMRKQELALLERYPEVDKTEYHDLDESYSLTRIVYKTSATEDGEGLTMPIPLIAAKAIRLLSELSEIMDGKKTGPLNLSDITFDVENISSPRINKLINHFCKRIDIDEPPTPHQFRHAMAFSVAHMNDKNGLELARLFLGHKSIEMTLRYLGHFNTMVKQAVQEFRENESMGLLDVIVEQIENDIPMVGPVAKRMMQGNMFVGNITDEFKDTLTRSLRILVETKRLAIIQTPTNLCFHDLAKPDQMLCQRGFSITDFTGIDVVPSACEGSACGCSLYTKQHVEALKKQKKILLKEYPEELRERLLWMTRYANDGLQNHDTKIIDEYEQYIKEAQ